MESVLSSAALVSNGGAVRNLTNVINGFGKATGDQGQAFGDLIKDSNRLLGTLNTRSAQISEALTQTAQLADQLDTKNQTLTDIVKEADPATETRGQHRAALPVGFADRRHHQTIGEVPVDRGYRYQRP